MIDDGHRNFGRNALKVVIAICVLAYLTTFHHDGMNVGTVIHISAWIAICSLSGLWIGLGNFSWRFPIVIAVAIATAFITSYYRRADILLFYLFSFGIVAIVGMISFAARLRYGELRKTHDRSDIADALQFNVRDLMIWTTAIAVTIAFGRWLFSHQGYPGVDSFFLVCALIGTLVIASLVAIWAFLGQRLTAGRIIAFAVVIAILAMLNSAIASSMFWLSTTLVSQVLIIAAIYCLRLQDYRFVIR